MLGAAFLTDKARGVATIDVLVTTRVSKPNDVFDKYGRFVGDLLLSDVTNLNHWMLAAGWAFPHSTTRSRTTSYRPSLRPRRRARASCSTTTLETSHSGTRSSRHRTKSRPASATTKPRTRARCSSRSCSTGSSPGSPMPRQSRGVHRRGSALQRDTGRARLQGSALNALRAGREEGHELVGQALAALHRLARAGNAPHPHSTPSDRDHGPLRVPVKTYE